MEGLLDAFTVWNMAVEGIGGALGHCLGDHATDDLAGLQNSFMVSYKFRRIGKRFSATLTMAQAILPATLI